MRFEFGDPLVERNGAATWHEAFGLTFGALVVAAQSTKVLVAARSKQECIELLGDDAGALAKLVCLAKGVTGRAAKLAEPLL